MAVQYQVLLEDRSIDAYRRSHRPDGLVMTGMWVAGVFSGASGRRYHGMRGIDELGVDVAHTYQFCVLNDGDLDTYSPDLFAALPIDQTEPFTYEESADSVRFLGENMRVEASLDSYRWLDANGRFDVTCEFIGSPFTFIVLTQDGVAHPVRYRSQLGRASGSIDGDPVDGLMLLDRSYSKAGVLYFDIPLIRVLEKQWSMWLVEHTDGSVDAGLAWRGRHDTQFAPAHTITGGASEAHHTSVTVTTYNEKGTVWKTGLQVGATSIDLEQTACSDWPAHPFGHVVATSSGKEIARSWSFVEWMPDNIDELLELYFAGELKNDPAQTLQARVDGEDLVYPTGVGPF